MHSTLALSLQRGTLHSIPARPFSPLLPPSFRAFPCVSSPATPLRTGKGPDSRVPRPSAALKRSRSQPQGRFRGGERGGETGQGCGKARQGHSRGTRISAREGRKLVKDDGEEPLGKGRSAPYLGLTGGGIFFSFPLCLITTFVLVGVGLWPLDILAFLLMERSVSLLILDTFFCFPWSEHFGGDALFFTSVQNVSGTRLFPFKLVNRRVYGLATKRT